MTRASARSARRAGERSAGWAVGLPVLLAPALARAASAAHSHDSGMASRPLVLILAMAALSLIPFAFLMVTSFVRISVVLSILRSAIGTPSVPPTQVLTGLALVLTIAVMAPTGERMYAAIAPTLGMAAGADLTSGETIVALETAADRGKEPLRDFLLKHTAGGDRAAFFALAVKMRPPADRASSGAGDPGRLPEPPRDGHRSAEPGSVHTVTDRDFGVLVPAFITCELRRAFQIGFLLFIPFLVVDMVIANLLLALGMHMLSPTTVSLPFKLLLFVLADGWNLVIRGLLESYL